MSRTSKSAEENLAKPCYGTTKPMSKSKVKEMREMTYGDVEVCCGTTCDRGRMQIQQKLLGVQDFIRLLKRTTPLTDGQVYVLDTIASEYKMTLIPLK